MMTAHGQRGDRDPVGHMRGGGRCLPKCLPDVEGFDEIAGGGLPRGHATLVCGAAGSGQTLLGAKFLRLFDRATCYPTRMSLDMREIHL